MSRRGATGSGGTFAADPAPPPDSIRAATV